MKLKCATVETVVEQFAASRELCAFLVRAQYMYNAILMDGSHSPGIINESIKSNHEQQLFGSNRIDFLLVRLPFGSTFDSQHHNIRKRKLVTGPNSEFTVSFLAHAVQARAHNIAAVFYQIEKNDIYNIHYYGKGCSQGFVFFVEGSTRRNYGARSKSPQF
jgi:hypothetical protein